MWVPTAWLPSETSMIHLGFWGLTTAGWLLKTCAHDITQSNVTELLDLPASVCFCVCDVRQHSTGISGDFAVRPASKQSWAREIRAPLACKGGGRYRFNAASSCDSPRFFWWKSETSNCWWFEMLQYSYQKVIHTHKSKYIGMYISKLHIKMACTCSPKMVRDKHFHLGNLEQCRKWQLAGYDRCSSFLFGIVWANHS